MNSIQNTRTRRHDGRLALDEVLSTQPELGPSIPDGGYGWFVFIGTLFFQALIPNLIVSFGIFLAFSKLKTTTPDHHAPQLWDDKLLHVPLFFTASWTFFDPITRVLNANTTWPWLVSTTGTSLTCAGLLFMWMGMTGHHESSFYILGGLVSGIGASIQISLCEIILAQYFKLKHNVLSHITQAVTALGFIVAPIAVGHHVINTHLLNVTLWYQCIILQGLVVGLIFRKPSYMKNRQRINYNVIKLNADDEEDIFSKDSKELQIKRQSSTDEKVTTEKLSVGHVDGEIRPSGSGLQNDINQYSDNLVDLKHTQTNGKNWVAFENETGVQTNNLNGWETFEDEFSEDDASNNNPVANNQRKWEEFNDSDGEEQSKKPSINLKDELDLAKELPEQPTTTSVTGLPLPLFSDLPINNNISYAYDDLEARPESHQPVFMPNAYRRSSVWQNLELLKQPTFYKSLLMVVTTKFSYFVFFALFPTFLYHKIDNIKMSAASTLIGVLSVTSLAFSVISYWVNIDKKRRAICLWFLCWVGAFGYFMLTDFASETAFLVGAVQIVVSIASLQYVGGPLMGLTVRGEIGREYGLISWLSSLAFIFFLLIDSSIKDCFRLMAILHFVTGSVWFSNYVYNKVMKITSLT